ncbi:Crp/Fnr family transcriptional regulator [Arenibaculum pallidiluteum]|uniref:Crp/Fnr family transcriptional regulator n=1 Tax=Arenibaculum pallidiluteum TaxID=2812559 RepID=UPI001A95A5E6|nr:Crp/Fnr family transcriptional regulator [Arenibaculum pallidiluteum]
MPLAPDRSILQGMELFVGLGPEELDDVLRRGHARRLPKDTRVLRQGDPPATCHALVDGRVKIVQTTPEGTQVVLRFIGPGEMYGTLAVLMERPYPADAVAVVDSVEVYWSDAAMRELMEIHPRIGLNASRIVGGRMMDMQASLRELASAKVERRIAHALLRLVRQAGKRVPEGVEIDFPITRQDLASMTGSTLHTVSRTLSAWEERGIVESTRRHIVIRRPHDLVAIAEDLPEPRDGKE